MTVLLCTILSISILIFPISIIYYLIFYLFIYGFSQSTFINSLKITIGTLNIYPLDLLFINMIISLFLFFIKYLIKLTLPIFSKETKLVIISIIIYLLYNSIYFIIGYFDNVPIDSMTRYLYLNLQSLYILIPLFCIKKEYQIKRILYFTIALSCIFPFIQLTLAGTADTQFIFLGQDTLRLGHGNFSAILAFSMLALLCWKKITPISALPGAGLIMLAHRSAYIAILVSALSLAQLQKKRLKTVLLLTSTGSTILILLFILQSTTDLKVFERGLERASQTFQKTGTTGARFDALKNSIDIFTRYPMFGIGYKLEHNLQQQEEVNTVAFNVLHPHNFILKSLTSGGIFGTAILLWIIVYALRSAHRLSRMEGKREVGSFLFSCILFFLIFSTMNANFETDGYLFWLLLGILFWYFNENAGQSSMGRSLEVES